MADRTFRFGVVLSGCGVFDGTEIHEAVCTLLAIDRADAEARCYAPDMDQAQVVNHISGEVAAERRNVLVEAARIARGKIADLATFTADDVDALIIPGGFGAAKNLCDFAFKGADCTVHPDVEAAVRAMAAAGKPIGALCIAPVILARLFGREGVELTIGSDAGTAGALESMGARHTATTHCEVVVDRTRKVVTAPCYMLDATVSQIADGAANAVKALMELAD
ncbi:isoprenoid biosynthesis glyoxalase ElbB [Azospirillum sp. ST 5-10]|uniref:isoprenoid biosynthesis glyoxalase ElbB n=1 Tax=unclassified Azospirillum TaxID=2630922 RepID=UPI003F4A222D